MLLSKNQYKKILFKIKKEKEMNINDIRKLFFELPENSLIDLKECFLKSR